MNKLLQAKNISKSFGLGNTLVEAVKDLDLEVPEGELLVIMGPSGSGKTTLLSMLGAMLKPDKGEIKIDNVDITQMTQVQLSEIRSRKIGFIFQAFNLLQALNVEENILFPSRLIPNYTDQARQQAAMLMERLNLSARRKALPKTLSGGEKQRTAIARALINNPAIILADEPTGNLDSQSGQDVMMILKEIAQEQARSIILVTHDSRIEEIADRIMWLEDGYLKHRREEHVWSHCPVCNMRVDEWASRYSMIQDNNRVVFCSKICMEKFAQKV